MSYIRFPDVSNLDPVNNYDRGEQPMTRVPLIKSIAYCAYIRLLGNPFKKQDEHTAGHRQANKQNRKPYAHPF